MDTPVIFIVFNRPDTTRKVFAAIRAARPAKLLVIADGPRPHKEGEAERCAETRALIDDGVDWPCEVLKDYSPANLGCKRRLASGLTWAFGKVEEAIILEDDCLPHPSFFRFCAEMLERYRHDERVFSIGGSNIHSGARAFPYSYYCSRYPQIWGWAAWRRTWEAYDVGMRLWPEAKANGLLRSALKPFGARVFWEDTFEKCHRGEIDTWDYQLTFACMLGNGLNLVAAKNLISNIGFDSAATHTTASSPLANLPLEALEFPLSHPPYLFPDPEAEAHFHREVFRAGPRRSAKHAWGRLSGGKRR